MQQCVRRCLRFTRGYRFLILQVERNDVIGFTCGGLSELRYGFSAGKLTKRLD